jgi:hypothetical protein
METHLQKQENILIYVRTYRIELLKAVPKGYINR